VSTQWTPKEGGGYDTSYTPLEAQTELGKPQEQAELPEETQNEAAEIEPERKPKKGRGVVAVLR